MLSEPSCRNPDSPVVVGEARFTVLADGIVRLEYAEDGVFEDRASLTAVRSPAPRVAFSSRRRGERLELATSRLHLEYSPDGQSFHAGNLRIGLWVGGEQVWWQPGVRDRRNLGGTARTLDGVDGAGVKLGPGLISRSGWALVDDSSTPVLSRPADGRQRVCARRSEAPPDWYFLGYGHDYTEALRDAAGVFGRQPLPPRYAFGYWWSRYWAYTDREFEDLVEQFDRMDVPIDVLVIDMDWHLDGWTGYTWDRRLFPDPVETVKWLKARGLNVTLNLHPADGVGRHEAAFDQMCSRLGMDPAVTERIPFDCTDPAFMDAYFELLHHPEEEAGVDFWWMDWQQGSATKLPGLDPLPWLNHLHWHDMAGNAADRRPLIFSRFGGLGAGRYPVGFSGDTHSTWRSLAFQPHFTATAANVLYGYWSHDIGGHQPGEIEPELYLRWVQYGTFSPVLRTHTTKNERSERRFWEYPAPYSQLLVDAIRRRYALVPYIYSEARKCRDNGVSLCRPMYYGHPEEDMAYRVRGQYMFGDHLLVAPVVAPSSAADGLAAVSVWLPPGPWFDTATGEFLEGGRKLRRRYLLREIPVFVRPGAVIPGQRATRRLRAGSYRELVFTVYPGDSGEYTLYEDDGVSQDYVGGAHADIRVRHCWHGGRHCITVDSARGRYDGFAAARSLEIRLPSTPPPQQVSADGENLAWEFRLGETGWTYDGDSAETIVRLACFDVTKGMQIEVVTEAGPRADLGYGLKGLMARLKELPFVAMPWHVDCQVDPRKKLPFVASQTGNRVSRWPDRFAAELDQLKVLLPDLSEALRWVLRQVPDDDRARRAVERRLKLLRHIRRNLPPGLRQVDAVPTGITTGD